MRGHDVLYQLYEQFDTGTIRDRQNFVDLFPPIDSRVALEQWQDVSDELAADKDAVRDAFDAGETLAGIAAVATRDEAFTALDLYGKYGRPVNVLVLDVDETLRTTGRTDNEISRETLHFLTELHRDGVPVVICTGQTLENVKGFLVQGLGSAVFNSGSLSVVYEGGTGVFTPGHGSGTKQLLYETLDDEISDVFYDIRSRILPEAPTDVARECHLQGNEFNVTLKPNFETGSREAVEIIDRALVHLVDLLGTTVGEHLLVTTVGEDDGGPIARRFYAERDPEIRRVFEDLGAMPSEDDLPDVPPGTVADGFGRIDVGYYQGDAAEVTSLDLNKAVGVERALEVLGVEDPFALVMGDSTSDLRVMEWVAERDAGIAAAPEHATADALDHVIRTDELVFDRGDAARVLRMAHALNRVSEIA